MSKRIIRVTITGTVEIETDQYPDDFTEAQQYVDLDFNVDSASSMEQIEIQSIAASWV